MPKQISPVVKIKGQIDQLNFFESQDGYMVRKAAKYSKDKYLTSDTYRITRGNASEFGTAGNASRVFREAWNREINKASDNRLTSRITKTMFRALRTDPISKFGFRRVEKGTFKDLEGLEFNAGLAFRACVVPKFPVSIARATGLVNVNLPVLTPLLDIKAPSGATHYSFFAAAGAIDFLEGTSVVDSASTAALPWSDVATVASSLSLTLPANSILPIFVILGIEFKFIVNGDEIPFTGNASALQVIAVDKLVVPQL
jgi:hypothetical protein